MNRFFILKIIEHSPHAKAGAGLRRILPGRKISQSGPQNPLKTRFDFDLGAA